MKRPAVAAGAALGLLSALSNPAAPAEVRKRLEVPDLAEDSPVEGREISETAWVPGSTKLSFLVRPGTGEAPSPELYVEDARGGSRERLVGASDLKAGPTSPNGADGTPSLEGYQWSPEGGALLLAGDRHLWLYRVRSKTLERLTDSPDKEEYPSFSPDGRRVAFVRKNNLVTLDLSTHAETVLTHDGGDHVFNGRLDWVYEEEISSHGGRAYEWSPDGQALVYLRLDESGVPSYPLVDFLGLPHSQAEPQRYPNPGDPNSLPSVHVVGIEGKERAAVSFPGRDLYVVPDFSWLPDSAHVAYEILDREQTHLEVRVLDVASSTTAHLLEEHDPYWINLPDRITASRRGASLFFLGSHRFLWLSERTGFTHLYQGETGSASLKPVTRGSWMIESIVGIDEQRGYVYFTATDRDPRERHISRVRWDGSGLTRLTTEPGTHGGVLSPDGEYISETFADLRTPKKTRLLSSSGALVRVVDDHPHRLGEFDLPKTEFVEWTAADGTKFYGRLTRPPDFDRTRRYPVVVYVYGGPHVEIVRNDFERPTVWDVLASRGYLVWSMDNRGSWGRGHAFESPIFKDMGRVELSDQLEGVRYLRTLPYVDPGRLGITGWSYGGYMTLYALTHSPGTWKCGAAGAPVVDWRLYDTIYTERYMRTPKDNPAGYETSSPLAAASKVRAKILLLHGTADDNVHMYNTLHFVDALVKAGIPHALQIQPGQKHGFRGARGREARDRALLAFFEDNL